jgi:hypothetical protein
LGQAFGMLPRQQLISAGAGDTDKDNGASAEAPHQQTAQGHDWPP